MEKISAAFDGLKFSRSTLEYGIDLASKSDALLSGIFLDDFTHHSYNIYDMVGSQGVSKEKVKKLINADKAARLKSAEAFEQACIKANIKHVVHHDKSIASQELIKESIYTDLVLINSDETFNHFTEVPPTQFIRDLLIDMQCPVIIIPKEYKRIEKVVLLYDGKPASVFAIKMFNYMLPWMKDLETEVVSVMDPQDRLELPDNNLIREFVKCHYPDATYNILYGKPEEEIVAFVRDLQQNVLIVLGAYSRNTVSRWFKTSMADILMKEVSVPMFVAHNKG
ncbi:universal stress protein [Pedobacter sp. P351]|uniref:universal stress protein n=1 Tax=Pedobacter superstes TaxID=3133441 RepID=UPI00309C8B92